MLSHNIIRVHYHPADLCCKQCFSKILLLLCNVCARARARVDTATIEEGRSPTDQRTVSATYSVSWVRSVCG